MSQRKTHDLLAGGQQGMHDGVIRLGTGVRLYIGVLGAEELAIKRVKELFGAEHANVQPHSGAQANNAVMHALLTPGEKIMGLSLAHGGHLSHGMKLNVSGKLYEVVAYEVGEDGRIDMEQVRQLALAERPKVIIAGWSAYPRQLDSRIP